MLILRENTNIFRHTNIHRLIVAVFTALLLLQILFPSIATAQEPITHTVYLPIIQMSFPNLLTNPSFEASPDSVSPWQWLTDTVDYQLAADSQIAPNGQQYLAVDRQNGDFGNKSLYQDVALPQAGKTYNFAVWVRASDEAVQVGKPRTGRLALWAFGGSAAREHSTRNFQVNDTKWHCVETSLSVQEAGHATLRAEIYLTSLDTFDTYFDFAALRDDGKSTCPPTPPDNGSVLISNGQGFDACAAPTVSQLAAWKQTSPYQYFGIYLGGSNHYTPCKNYNQQNQTAAWYSSVSGQGWQFIPIWVGPQAACTAYGSVMSDNPDTARSQGVTEAQLALQAAQILGLIGASKPDTIIYYDLEYYDIRITTCHNAANAFLEGWVSELQNRGHKAGIYGSVYAVNDWYTLGHVPDSVWVPWYIESGYTAGMTIDPLNQQWITESYWDNHRLFQYSGSHTEVWNGVGINIDNDTARGLVTLDVLEQPPLPNVQAMQLLTSGKGWVLIDNRLYRAGFDASDWDDISPPTLNKIEAVRFLDLQQHGWVVTRAGNGSDIDLWQTADGGSTWQPHSLTVQTGGQGVDTLYLDFVNAQNGWLVIKLPTGPNFSQALLFKTVDGGTSWVEKTIPLGEPVRFVSESTGWVAGGPTNSEIYVTRDGGTSWQQQSPAGNDAVYALPTFVDSQTGVLPVTAGQNLLEIYTTGNEGRTWQLVETSALSQDLAIGASLPIAIINEAQWVVPEPALNIVDVQMASSLSGWARVITYNCADNRCQSESQLLKTTDSGQSWEAVTLPTAS